jgi:DNA-binding MarR family transcriptional regulator
MSETRWLDADEQRAWRAFLTATQLLFEGLDRQLQRDSALSHSYYEILVRLSEAPDRTLRMSQLAERSQFSRSRLSHAVARLEQMGWIQRSECREDRRGQLATLTGDGFAALEAAAPGHVEAVRSMLLDPLTGEQVAQLREISEAIVAHAEGRVDTAPSPA